MKKKLVVLMLVIVLLLSGCGQSVQRDYDEDELSMFVIVEQSGSWRIVYHKETKVMYAVSYGSYNCGTFTVLVNADGSPMLFTEGWGYK